MAGGYPEKVPEGHMAESGTPCMVAVRTLHANDPEGFPNVRTDTGRNAGGNTGANEAVTSLKFEVWVDGRGNVDG